MKYIPCAPGSVEWMQARSGIPTASCFDKIVTKTGKPSSQAFGYACLLAAETLLGANLDELALEWMQRGKDLEEEAVNYYELLRDVETQQGGFCTTDDGRFGCSPDRLIGDDGGLEIKCPAPQTHIRYMLWRGGAGDATDDDVTWKYRLQVQGSLWVTGRAWWDVLSYCPGLDPVLIRVERDDDYLEQIEPHLYAMRTRLDFILDELGKGRLEGA